MESHPNVRLHYNVQIACHQEAIQSKISNKDHFGIQEIISSTGQKQQQQQQQQRLSNKLV
jgi:hypothetical protein